MAYRNTDKHREYMRKWMRKRRVAWFAANGPCVECGSWERLELDHRDPRQKVTHCVWSWSEKRRLEEVAKCQVLCHDCHLKKTIAQRKPQLIHGTYYGYNTTGCRCDACRLGYWMREKLARKGYIRPEKFLHGTMHVTASKRKKTSQDMQGYAHPQIAVSA